MGEAGKGGAVLNEPEPEKRRRAQALSMGGVRGKHLQLNMSGAASFCYCNYLVLLLYGCKMKVPLSPFQVWINGGEILRIQHQETSVCFRVSWIQR
jgi:hypothetical protein